MGSSRSRNDNTASHAATTTRRAAASSAAGFAVDACLALNQQLLAPVTRHAADRRSRHVVAVENLRTTHHIDHSTTELFGAT